MDIYIFGGYAEQAWDSSDQFKLDPNWLMFCLIHLNLTHKLLLHCWESIKAGIHQKLRDTKGIYCHPNYNIYKEFKYVEPNLNCAFHLMMVKVKLI
jgi:hypothetical protein